MLVTTDDVIAAWLSPSRQLSIRVKMNDVTYGSEDITSLSFDSGSISGETYQIGSTYMNSIQLVFPSIIETVKEDLEVVPELAVLVNGNYEYTKLGHFFIDEFERNRNSNTTTIKATDKMRFMEGPYDSKLSYKKPYREVALEVANLAGVEINEASFSALGTAAINKPEGYTFRQAIGLIAQFEGGFASFNRNGELEIRRLALTNFEITPESYMLKGFTKNEVSYRIGGITVKTGEEETDVIRVGSTNGSQVQLENKVMTQQLLNQIWELVKNLNYFPYELKWRGCPPLEAGDLIYITANDGTKYSVPNLSYSITFNGGMSAESKATTSSSSQATYKYRGPLSQRIDYLDTILSSNNWNSTYYDTTEPLNPKEGDIWFKPNGKDREIWIYKNVDGVLKWVMEITSAGDPELLAAIEDAKQAGQDAEAAAKEAKEEAESAKQAGENAANLATQAGLDAQAAKDKADAIKIDVNGLVSDVATINGTVSSISSKANQAYDKANAVEGRTATLETSVTGLTGRMTDIETTSTSTTKKLNELVVTVDGQKQTIATVTTTADSALNKANVLEATVDGVTQTLTSVETTANSALSKVNTVSSTVDGHTQLIASTKTTADSALSKAVATETTANGLITTISSVETTANSALSKALQVEATASRITQTVVSIQEDLNSLSETTSSQFTQLSDQMNFKLTSSDGGVTQIDMQNQIVTISSENIYLTGKSNISDAIIKTAHIADLAVSNGKIANLAVTEGKIGDAAITNAKIGNLAVSTAKIADGAIVNAKIGDAAITNAKIADASISSAKIINLDASKIVANSLAAITTNTGTLNVTGWLTMSTENRGMMGTYDFGDQYESAFNYRWFVGDWRLSHRHLIFTGKAYTVTSSNNKGSYLYDVETFYGNDYMKMRQYNSSGTLLNRIDINSDGIAMSDRDWGGGSRTIIRSNGTADFYSRVNFNAGIDVAAPTNVGIRTGRIDASLHYDTISINAERPGLTDVVFGISNVNFNTMKKGSADWRIGLDGIGRVIQSMAVYNRTSSSSSNMYITESGTLGRSTSATKYKLNITEAPEIEDLGLKLLTVMPKYWFDKSNIELAAKDLTYGGLNDVDPITLRPHYGLIAEDLLGAGLEMFISTKYQTGEIEGIEYDRLWVTLIPIVKSLVEKNVLLEVRLNKIERVMEELVNG